jgi:hypothetical protein
LDADPPPQRVSTPKHNGALQADLDTQDDAARRHFHDFLNVTDQTGAESQLAVG